MRSIPCMGPYRAKKKGKFSVVAKQYTEKHRTFLTVSITQSAATKQYNLSNKDGNNSCLHKRIWITTIKI